MKSAEAVAAQITELKEKIMKIEDFIVLLTRLGAIGEAMEKSEAKHVMSLTMFVLEWISNDSQELLPKYMAERLAEESERFDERMDSSFGSPEELLHSLITKMSGNVAKERIDDKPISMDNLGQELGELLGRLGGKAPSELKELPKDDGSKKDDTHLN